MSRNTLADICVVCGLNSDTDLKFESNENEVSNLAGPYGPYKQNVIGVFSEKIAYFPESPKKINGLPYYSPKNVICPKIPVVQTRKKLLLRRSKSIFQAEAELVLPHSMEVVQNIPSCCFPSGGYIYTKPKPVEISFSVLTNMEGVRTYAVYLTNVRKFTAIEVTGDHDRDTMKLLNDNLSNGESATQPISVYVPLCICLISAYPYFNTMKDCLSSMVPHLSKPEDELWLKIMNLSMCLTNILVPPPGPLSIEFPLFGNKYIIHPPDEAERRVVDIDLHLPLLIFSPANVIQIITCLLTQQRLIFISSEYALLTIVLESFFTYIDPIKWRLPYVPVLPNVLVDLMEATGPFIMGVHSHLRPQVKQVRKDPESCIVLVDIDKGTVDIDEHTIVPKLPNNVSQSLEVRLKKSVVCFDVTQVSLPTVYTLKEHKSRRAEFLDTLKSDIKNTFLDMLVSLFGDIYHHIAEDSFKSNSYLQSKPEDERDFFKEVIQSDSFNIFIEDRINHRDQRDAFTILGERYSSRKNLAQRKSSNQLFRQLRNSTSLGMIFVNKNDICKISDDVLLDMIINKNYNSYIDELTTQINKHLPGPLTASYRYLRGISLIKSDNHVEGLRDLYSLYSTALAIFPADYVTEILERLDEENLMEIKNQPFYRETALLRKYSLTDLNSKLNTPRNFSKPNAKLNQEKFITSIMALKIAESEDVAAWLFAKMVIENDGDLVLPDQFATLCNMYMHLKGQWDNKEVSGVNIDTENQILRVSDLVCTGIGMGHVVLTTEDLLFVRPGVRDYTVVTPLCDIKEITKYQQFSVNFLTGVQALKMTSNDPSRASFCSSLKDDCNTWLALINEMAAGQKAAINLSNPKMVSQAACNILIVQALLAMGLPLSVASGACMMSACKSEEIGRLTEETRESLVIRLDPFSRQGQRTTVMSVAFVSGPNSGTLWCGLGSGVIVVYDVEHWDCIAELRCAKTRISCLRVVSSKQIWAGSFDSAIYVINTDTTKTDYLIQKHWRSVSDIALDEFSANSELVWSSGFDGQVFCWNSQTRDCITSFKLETRTLCRILPTQGKKLWCLSQDKIFVVDTSLKECPLIQNLAVAGQANINNSTAMLFGKELWVGSKVEGRFIAWNIDTYDYTSTKVDPRVQATCMLQAEGSVWFGNRDGSLFVYSPTSKVVEREMHAHTDVIMCMCKTDSGNVITGSSSKDGQVCVWNTNMGFEVIDGVRKKVHKKTYDDIKEQYEVVDEFKTERIFGREKKRY